MLWRIFEDETLTICNSGLWNVYFRLDFPLKKIVLWINGIVYKNMLEMLEEEFFKIKICVTIVIDCEIFEFRLDLSI